LDPTSKKCVFLGYGTEVKGYRLWDPVDCKLIVSREVTFNEARSLKEGEKAQSPDTDKGKSPVPDVVEGEIDQSDDFFDIPQGEAPRIEEQVPDPQDQEEQVQAGEPQERPAMQDQPESSVRRSVRIHHAPERYGKWAASDQLQDDDIMSDNGGNALILEEGEPSSYREAQASPQKLEWDAAMRREI
jgi:hypothetical protein